MKKVFGFTAYASMETLGKELLDLTKSRPNIIPEELKTKDSDETRSNLEKWASSLPEDQRITGFTTLPIMRILVRKYTQIENMDGDIVEVKKSEYITVFGERFFIGADSSEFTMDGRFTTYTEYQEKNSDVYNLLSKVISIKMRPKIDGTTWVKGFCNRTELEEYVSAIGNQVFEAFGKKLNDKPQKDMKKDAAERLALAIYMLEIGEVKSKSAAITRFGTTYDTWRNRDDDPMVKNIVNDMRKDRIYTNRIRNKVVRSKKH